MKFRLNISQREAVTKLRVDYIKKEGRKTEFHLIELLDQKYFLAHFQLIKSIFSLS
jgi:hypothetical protein